MRFLVIDGLATGVFVDKQVRALRQLGVRSILVAKRSTSRLAYLPSLAITLWKVLMGRYALVHAHFGFYSALLPAIFKRRPLIVTFHGSDALIDPRRHSIYKVLQKFVVRRAEWVIAVSRQVAEALVSKLGADPSRLSVISCGVRTDTFRQLDKGACRRKFGIDDHSMVVIFVGELKPLKGIDLLVAAAERMPDVLFLLVGAGSASGTPHNCRLLGPQPNERIPELMSAADVLVLPSRSEGTPVVILEALACGIPVVASKVGGIPAVITDGVAGYLVEPGDVDMLVDRLRRVLSDPEKARQMGFAGRELVAKVYDGSEIAKRVLKVYQDVLSNYHNRTSLKQSEPTFGST